MLHAAPRSSPLELELPGAAAWPYRGPILALLGGGNTVLLFLLRAGGDTAEQQDRHNSHQRAPHHDTGPDRQRSSAGSSSSKDEEPDMAQPIQRARKALREAVTNGEAQQVGSYHSEMAEAEMEEGLARRPGSRSCAFCLHGMQVR